MMLPRLLTLAGLLAASLLSPVAHAEFSEAGFGRWLQDAGLGLEQRLAGLETRDVQVGDQRWHLFTRQLDSAKPCIVMVHGFTARGAHWFRMARRLPDDRCLIVVDLPGFGASGFDPKGQYDTATQADRLSALLLQLKPANPRVDMIGNSMGGFITAQFALRHPAQTRSIALLDAAGVHSPTPSLLRQQIKAGRNGFFATNLDEYRRFYAMTMNKAPYVPDAIIVANGEEALARRARHQYIFGQIHERYIDDRLHDIRVPTLIAWGDHDQLLDISMMRIWSGIPGSRTHVFPGIGHMPHLECPADAAALYTEFLAPLN